MPSLEKPSRLIVIGDDPLRTEQRPICVIAVTIDEVAIENPASGETLATWDVDRQDPAGRRAE